MSYFEILKEQINSQPSINKSDNVLYVVGEGPSGSGKSSVTRQLANVLTYNVGMITQERTDANFSPSVYTVIEPPDIRLEVLPTESVRTHLRSGKELDPREQIALFMLARRKLQEEIYSDTIGVASDSPFHQVNDFRYDIDDQSYPLRLRSIDPNKRLVISDRGVASSKVYQVRGPSKLTPSLSHQCDEVSDTAFKKGFLGRYDLTFFIQPQAVLKAPDADDFFEGKIDEARVYGEEIASSIQRRVYSTNTIWLDNDPTGRRNTVSIPVMFAAAASSAVWIHRVLITGTKYVAPFYINPRTLELSPSDLTRDIYKETFSENGLKSGNVVLRTKNKFEVEVELTSDLPLSVT